MKHLRRARAGFLDFACKKWFRAPDKRLFKQLQKTLIAPD